MSKETTAAWKKNHPRAVKAAQKRYRRKHIAELRVTAMNFKREHFELVLLAQARCRARRRGQPFSIIADDIHVPTLCPALGMPLRRDGRDGRSAEDFPTLDCIIPSLGYVPGNIAVISMRANRIKYNASWTELQQIANWVRREVSYAER